MGVDVTIILPIYNEKIKYIEESIGSILCQSFERFELLVCLDNPANIVLREYVENLMGKDGRIRFLINEQNLGLPATLNRMINEVNTKYIARMDADDIAVYDRLEKQFNYMEENPECEICGTNIDYINLSGDYVKNNGDIPVESTVINECLKYKNCMSHPTYFAKTSIMKYVQYRENLRYAQDYDFICRCAEQGLIIHNINDVLLHYRIGNVSPNKLMRQSMTAYFVKMHYKQGTLCTKDDIASEIQDEINKYGEEELTASASYKNLIKEILNSVIHCNIKRAIKLIRLFIFPHPYRIDVKQSEKEYRKLLN